MPGVFTEGKLDLSLLCAELGLRDPEPFEHYMEPLRWEEPINIPTAHNSLICGDNLEVLRCMSHFKDAVKMIFIDPPYNTGNDLVYQDRRIDHSKSSQFGRLHASWLEMMTPRLQYAHALLRKDGAIFIAIDDHELAVLRLLCDQIFGADNFVQTFIWLHGKGKKDRHSRTMQQYILCYAKDRTELETWRYRVRKEYTSVSNPDQDRRGAWFSGSISFTERRSNTNHPNYYSIRSPSGIQWNRQWQCSKEQMNTHLLNNDIYFGPEPEYNRVPRLKIFPHDDDIIPPSVLRDCGNTRSAQRHLDKMFDGDPVFSYPKPLELMVQLIRMATKPGDIVLDFFAGSGTTLHASLSLHDEGGRICCCIQSAERTAPKSVAHKKGMQTIFDIAYQRILRVYQDLETALPKTSVLCFQRQNKRNVLHIQSVIDY